MRTWIRLIRWIQLIICYTNLQLEVIAEWSRKMQTEINGKPSN